jgi:hypothetical protein
MAYRLRTGLTFCRSEGRTIFLDVEADRYFEVSQLLGAALDRFADEGAPDDVQTLVDHGLVVLAKATAELAPVAPFVWPAPETSRIERDLASKLSLPDLLVVGSVLAATAGRLRRKPFKQTLERLRLRRVRLIEAPEGAAVQALADRFLVARRLLPLFPICLRDSLALIDFLALHGWAADLVIGVEAAPFSAHCWVQSGGCALNETVHEARRHTPILAV